MKSLFQSAILKNIHLKNRFVRSATWLGMATSDGAVTSNLIKSLTELAKGGVGLIVTGHAFVEPDGQATPLQLGAYKDDLVAGLKELADAIHDSGGKVILQLAHAGLFADEKIVNTKKIVSEIDGVAGNEMTETDISALVNLFAEAAQRAKFAGFDGVQIHSAHGYLLSQFLSPIYNKRKDFYGGSIENRCRIHREILKGIRDKTDDFPVLIKMNGRDYMENGLELDESLKTAILLEEAGFDGIEISGGLLTGGKLSPSRPGIDDHTKEAYFQEELKSFRSHLSVPLILVGGIRSFEVAQNLLNQGADYIALSRPLIREPDFINRWKSGNIQKAACLSDNRCFTPGFRGKGVFCLKN